MRIYRPSKRPLILIYAFLAGLVLVVRFALGALFRLIERYVEASTITIIRNSAMIPLAGAAGLFALIVLPFYFRKARFTVTGKEITAVGGLFVTTKHFLMTSSVRSVTAVMLPLGRFTAFNFIILNALGARVVLPFLCRRDAEEIAATVNNSIRSRGEK